MDIRNKFKDIEAISMGSNESLVLSFHGFQDKDEVREFADYIFSRNIRRAPGDYPHEGICHF